jgi:beta-N-acetylhexosaminidase
MRAPAVAPLMRARSSVPLARARSAAARTRAPAPAPLSVSQLAGQRIIYAYAGLTPPASLLAAIRAGEAAGVILFANNIGSPSQLHSALRALDRAAAAGPVAAPPLVLTDQEGGQVRRLPGAPVQSERQIGQSPDAVGAAAAAGTGAGRTLARAGVDVNLAPVLDVLRRPGNFIDQFQRSYGSDPRAVARLASAFVAAQQRLGVAATAKHFPGLGAASRSENTDLGPVILSLPLAQLRAIDEAPYVSAIAAGVKLVMTSWAVYPALDAAHPAGLSPRVVGHELRGRLRFRGVVVTDAITAGALRRFGSVGSRAVLAAQAGADLIICAAPQPSRNTPAIGQVALRALTAALRDGQLRAGAARQAASRVLALRRHP